MKLAIFFAIVSCALAAPQYEFYDEGLKIAYDSGVLAQGTAILHGPEKSPIDPIEIENVKADEPVPVQRILGPFADKLSEDVVQKLQEHVDSVPSMF
jgi:hypothetical protein